MTASPGPHRQHPGTIKAQAIDTRLGLGPDITACTAEVKRQMDESAAAGPAYRAGLSALDWCGHSYGGFGGGRPHLHSMPRTPVVTPGLADVTWRLAATSA